MNCPFQGGHYCSSTAVTCIAVYISFYAVLKFNIEKKINLEDLCAYVFYTLMFVNWCAVVFFVRPCLFFSGLGVSGGFVCVVVATFVPSFMFCKHLKGAKIFRQ